MLLNQGWNSVMCILKRLQQAALKRKTAKHKDMMQHIFVCATKNETVDSQVVPFVCCNDIQVKLQEMTSQIMVNYCTKTRQQSIFTF